MNKILLAGAVVGALAVSAGVSSSIAQNNNSGAATGAVTGAVGGAVIGGPVGAVVGGVGGAIVGGISDSSRPRFREYVVTQKRPSYAYREELRIGAELPATGVEYYEAPAEYGVRDYRYTIVNDRAVLVDPRTRRIVQIID